MKQIVTTPSALGNALKRARESHNLSQKEAGASMCLEQSTVSSLEQGAAGTRVDTVFRYLAALDLELVVQAKPPLDEI